MAFRWIRTKDHKPTPSSPQWCEDDWVLVNGEEVIARTYAFHHGPQAGCWFWALSIWGGHSGTEDTFEQARTPVKFRQRNLGKIP